MGLYGIIFSNKVEIAYNWHRFCQSCVCVWMAAHDPSITISTKKNISIFISCHSQPCRACHLCCCCHRCHHCCHHCFRLLLPPVTIAHCSRQLLLMPFLVPLPLLPLPLFPPQSNQLPLSKHPPFSLPIPAAVAVVIPAATATVVENCCNHCLCCHCCGCHLLLLLLLLMLSLIPTAVTHNYCCCHP